VQTGFPEALGASPVAHAGIPGLAPFAATGLFFVGIGAAVGAYMILQRRAVGLRRAAGIGLGAMAFGCFGLATALPLLIHATATFSRPATTARPHFVSPPHGAVIRGDPGSVEIALRLDDGKVVPFSYGHVPNEGHIHLSLDGKLAAMSTGLESEVMAAPGEHTLTAEFVAVDHGPFHPRVRASVNFTVRP
jgi:hypothetical protein